MMKTLANAVGEYVTGNEIADAVMEYSGALAEEQKTEVVDVPFLARPGLVRRVQLLIGWRTEVNSIQDGEDRDELIDTELTTRLRQKAERLRRPSGDAPFSRADAEDLFGHEDY